MRTVSRALLAAAMSSAAAEEMPFPPTFRQDAVDDRDFEFGDEYFLDVASFRFPADWDARWRKGANGFRGTGGSTSRDDLWLSQEGRWRKSLDDDWDFSYRFLQDLDLDGRVLKNVISMERRAPPFAFGPMAELDQFKEDLDLGATAAWEPSETDQVRAWSFWVDPLFNQKVSSEDRYERRPVTWALAGRHGKEDRFAWGAAWIPPTAVDLRSRGFTGFYEKRSFRLEGTRGTLSAEAAGEWVGKARDYTPADRRTVEVARTFRRAALSWRRRCVEKAQDLRLGLELVDLREWTRFPFDSASTHRLRRQEAIASAGVDRPLSKGWTARPTVLLDKLQNSDDFPLSPSAERRNTGFEAQLAPAFEYRFRNGAAFVLNPTVQLSPLAFGGGNAQLFIEF